jgi:hypothetical protein
VFERQRKRDVLVPRPLCFCAILSVATYGSLNGEVGGELDNSVVMLTMGGEVGLLDIACLSSCGPQQCASWCLVVLLVKTSRVTSMLGTSISLFAYSPELDWNTTWGNGLGHDASKPEAHNLQDVRSAGQSFPSDLPIGTFTHGSCIGIECVHLSPDTTLQY